MCSKKLVKKNCISNLEKLFMNLKSINTCFATFIELISRNLFFIESFLTKIKIKNAHIV